MRLREVSRALLGLPVLPCTTTWCEMRADPALQAILSISRAADAALRHQIDYEIRADQALRAVLGREMRASAR